MQISNDRYFRERQRHDLALRMIRHEARTCTIKSCTGLTDDRIRRLCKTYAVHSAALPVRRRGKSPRQVAFFTRNAHLLFESSCLTSVFSAFGLLLSKHELGVEALSLEFGALFCDAFETHRQLSHSSAITFEHAWFLLQQLNEGRTLQLARCRTCQGQFIRDVMNAGVGSCPTCRLKKTPTRRRHISNAPGRPRLAALKRTRGATQSHPPARDPADTLRSPEASAVRHGSAAITSQLPCRSIPEPRRRVA